MKVAVNARFLEQRVTGIQRYARALTGRLAGTADVDEVVALAPRGAATDVPMHVVRGGRLGGQAWEQLQLPRMVPADADVLWSPCNVGPVAVTPHVVTLHDVFALTHPAWVSRRFRAWHAALYPLLARRVAHVITVSAWTRGEIVRALRIPEARISVVSEGVDARFAPPSMAAKAELRRRLDLPEAFVLTLGSLEPRKNLQRVVRAWSRLPHGERLPLMIAGGLGDRRVFAGVDTDRLLNHPDVRLLGYVDDDDLPTLLGTATLMVYASLAEGFGLPPIEALACGTEVVTSETSAMAENCRDLAWLVDPRSERSIADGMSAALAARPSAADRNARSMRVHQRFDWDRAARETASVLARIGGR